MDEKIRGFVKDLESCSETHEIKRWQLRVKSYLDVAVGSEIADKFQSLNINDNPWDGSASQRGYLEALLAPKRSSNAFEGPTIMKRIDRINLIDKIGRELQSTMTYVDIKTYLSGFGVDTEKSTSDNGGSKWVYVKDLLGSEPEKIILEIADELEIEHDYVHQDIVEIPDSKFWHPNHFRLFLCHLSTFKVKTGQLQKILIEYGISSFVAHKDIEPTKEWQDEIEKALFSMDALAAILTPKFDESKWTDQEIGVAVGRDVLIIPIRKGMDPYGFIGKYQGMQGDGKTIRQVADRMFRILSNHPKTKEKLAGDLVDQITLANDAEDAAKKLTLLRSFEALPQKHLEKIRENCKGNKIIIDSKEFVELLNEMLLERELDPLVFAETYESSFDDDIPF